MTKIFIWIHINMDTHNSWLFCHFLSTKATLQSFWKKHSQDLNISMFQNSPYHLLVSISVNAVFLIPGTSTGTCCVRAPGNTFTSSVSMLKQHWRVFTLFSFICLCKALTMLGTCNHHISVNWFNSWHFFHYWSLGDIKKYVYPNCLTSLQN